MTTLATSMTDVLDAVLDQLQKRRERALTAAPSVRRAARLAELYEQEARLWSLLFERSQRRIQWRAALSAEAHARSCARAWRSQAHAYRGCVDVRNDSGLDGARS
jgi:hypothetical protein